MNRLRGWWPVLAWAALIWIFSTHYFTSDNTSRFLEPLIQWISPNVSEETIELLNAIVRKCAHFVEYFIFSLLVLRSLRRGRGAWSLKWALVTIGIVAGYASVDEFHQSFVPGRTPAIRDVLLDTAGGVFAQAIVGLWPARSRREFESPRAD